MVRYVLILLMTTKLLSQTDIYFDLPHYTSFDRARFARAIALGNTFTGIAEGIETTYYNTAGLVVLQSIEVIYSYNSEEMRLRGETLNDWGIVVPLGEMIGAVGFSQNRMHYQSNDEFFWDESVYKLHYAREFYEQLAFGVSINYYRFYQDNGSYANQRIYRQQ